MTTSASTAVPTVGGSALAPELDDVRRVLLALDGIGREITRAINEVGLGEWSSNAAIGVLSTLSLDGSARPSMLLGPTKLTRGGLSNLLERLEVAGLIKRQYGTVPGDRRGAVVTITETGTSTLAAINDVAARSAVQQHRRFDEVMQLLRRETAGDTAPISETAAPRITVHWLESLSRLGSELDEILVAAGIDDPTPVRSVIALCCAASPGGTRPGELIEQTGLSSGGVSQLLDRLENARLIRRRTGKPPDRRVVFVELTRKGRIELERRLRLVSIERLRVAARVD